MTNDFYINCGSVQPILRMELVDNGRTKTYHHIFESLQSAEIYFSMRNIDTGIMKVAKQPCYIKKVDDTGCEDRYVICYNWKKHDVNEKGSFEGQFDIKFIGEIECNEYSYPKGNLIVPIQEKLIIKVV